MHFYIKLDIVKGFQLKNLLSHTSRQFCCKGEQTANKFLIGSAYGK